MDLDNLFPIEDCWPTHCDNIAYYTEVIMNGELKIPEHKPPKEKIINTRIKVFLSKLASIPVHLYCGHPAGCKMLVAGKVWLGIEYSAAVPEQTVHFVHYDIPFQALITGGPCQEPIPPEDCDFYKFKLHACVEHLQVEQIDARTLQKVIVLMLWLERKDP